jgi:hypothetical protein
MWVSSDPCLAGERTHEPCHGGAHTFADLHPAPRPAHLRSALLSDTAPEATCVPPRGGAPTSHLSRLWSTSSLPAFITTS